MSQIVDVPVSRLQAQVLQALLEEYASRDGTDYGEIEHSLEQKVSSLRQQLDSGELHILYDIDSEHWDITPKERAMELLANE
jgi:uncharacterized protein